MTGIIRQATDADLPRLFALFARIYAHNPRMIEADYFRWQFSQAPGTEKHGAPTFLIQERDGEIVGCFGYVPVQFRHDGDVAWGAWTQNWYGENAQGGGLALLTEFFKRVDNRFMLRLSDSSETIYRSLRIPILHPLPRWWAAIDAENVAAQLGVRERVEQSAAMIATLPTAPLLPHIDRFSSDDEFRPDAFWPSIKSHCCRTGDYLNWRYFDAPRHHYRAIAVDGQLAVYRIEPIMASEFSTIRIMEWTFGPTDSPRALSTILAAAGPSRPILADFHCTADAIGADLERLGFVRQTATQTPMPDLFRPINHSHGYHVAIDLPPHRTRRSPDFASWYITAGEGDLDRVKL